MQGCSMADTIDRPQRPESTASVVLHAAATIARTGHAKAIFIFIEGVANTHLLETMDLGQTELFLVVRDESSAKLAGMLGRRCLTIPQVTLTRMSQIKTAALIAFSQRLLDIGDRIVFVAGAPGGQLDTIIVMTVGTEWEMFQTIDQPKLSEHVKRVVFERVLRIALELAAEGREGKPVGAIFVLGDTRNALTFCEQTVLNPFKGYSDEELNILDDTMRDTVKSFSTLDGAFIVKGSGVVVTAGAYLKNLKTGEVQQGLAARHAAAAGISASTQCIAISVSESTGTVRVWRKGQMITEIEKPPHGAHSTALGHLD